MTGPARVRVHGVECASVRTGTIVGDNAERILRHLEGLPPGTAVEAADLVDVVHTRDALPARAHRDARERAAEALRALEALTVWGVDGKRLIYTDRTPEEPAT